MHEMKNIKLIVTDLDGTLLHNDGKIPILFSDYLNRLKALNIQLMLASGRPLYTLRKTFKDYQNDLIISGDNGATIDVYGQIFHQSIFSRKDIEDLMAYTQQHFKAELVLSGLNSTILFESSKTAISIPEEFFGPIRYIHTLDDIEDEIVKFSLYFSDKSGKQRYNEELKPTLEHRFSVAYGDQHWVDITLKHVNKGEAVKRIAKQYNIDLNHILVFGNALNDKEMLSAVKHSYVVENAFTEVFEYANYTTSSNQDLGVFKIIEQVIQLQD